MSALQNVGFEVARIKGSHHFHRQCRALLAQPPPPPGPAESTRDLMLHVTGIDIERYPICQQGALRPLGILPPAPLAWDTS